MAENLYSKKPEISVIVCTYNRADLLTGALQSLVDQTLSASQFEIIIVDNGSTDSTAETVRHFQLTYTQNRIILIHEPRIGLGNARHTGTQSASGDLIGFMDDDAKADSQWLEKTVKAKKELPAPIHAIGGPVLPFYISPKPDWFIDRYVILTWGNVARKLNIGESFVGSNMFFPAHILKAISQVGIGKGMTGENLGFGEDDALFEKIWETYHKNTSLHYVPELIVYHAVSPEKMKVNYLLRRQFAIGQANYHRRKPTSFIGKLQYGVHQFASACKLFIRAGYHWFSSKTWQNWAIEYLSLPIKKLGTFAACVGINPTLQHRN